MTKNNDHKIISLPQQIFDQFIKKLGEQQVPEEVIVRLRKTLVDDEQVSVEALKAALFANDKTNHD
jgi:hypothetical protein